MCVVFVVAAVSFFVFAALHIFTVCVFVLAHAAAIVAVAVFTVLFGVRLVSSFFRGLFAFRLKINPFILRLL